MARDTALSRAARRAWHWLPDGVRGRAGGMKPPRLSVVIPVYNVEEYVEECLDSVFRQSLTDLEVIAVDDGSTDSSLKILREYATREPRLTVLHQQNEGQGSARNHGVTRARGTFLTFVDADDTIPPGAFAYMVRSLEKSGSDFSVGSVRRTKNGRVSNPWWVKIVHGQDRIGVTIDDFPEALLDVIAANRMFRRQFWLDKVGGFEAGIAYEDHVPMVAAYVRATTFDILKRPTYHWRMRENRTSTSQQKHVLKNLTDRITVKAQAQAIVSQEASASVYASWVARVLDTDLSLFIAHADAASDEYRRVLQDAMRVYVDEATPEAWRLVRFHQKVRTWLAADGAWDAIEDFAAYLREWGNVPPTKVVDGRVFADVPLAQIVGRDVPLHLLELGANETSLHARLKRSRWEGDSLVLEGWAYVPGVDLADTVPTVRVALRSETGDELDLPVELLVDVEATRTADTFNASYDTSGFRAVVDAAALPSGSRWTLRLTVDARGVTRSGPVHQPVPGSSAAAHALTALRRDDLLVVPQWDPTDGFVLTAEPPVGELVDVQVTGRTVVGTVTSDAPLTHVVASSPGAAKDVQARLSETGSGYAFSLELPPTTSDGIPFAATWTLRILGARSGRKPLVWSSRLPQRVGERGTGSVAAERSSRGETLLRADSPRADVRSAELTEDAITLVVETEGVSAAELATLRLANDRIFFSTDDVTPVGADAFAVRIPTSHRPFGGPAVPLDPGHYAFLLTLDDGREVKVSATAAYLETSPAETRTEALGVRFTVAKDGGTRATVFAPLTDLERSKYGQRQLRTWYQETAHVPEDSVLLQCYRGEFATDSQRAIHERLREVRPGLTLYWGVASWSTEVPEGAVPLLIGSRAWFEALGRSRYLCNNIDFDSFFRKGAHQRFLETFHGYPFKSMGRTFWEGKNLSAGRIRREIDRRNAEWDAIVVPSEECAEFYRQEYDYAGEILVTGYPRSDALVNADAPARRSEVLARLGIDPAKKVVLYAPTYRDALTTRVFAARLFDELDLAQFCAGVGEDVVLLLRGHNNNQRELDRERRFGQVVDVTDYPEINDLVLAADVAILDYSSLRFEWALTGKPAVFFVPDLDTYFEGRPPLFDYAPTAPGPLLQTTAEVVDAVRDADGVRMEYAEAIDAFNVRFNRLQDGHATERVVEAFFDR